MKFEREGKSVRFKDIAIGEYFYCGGFDTPDLKTSSDTHYDTEFHKNVDCVLEPEMMRIRYTLVFEYGPDTLTFARLLIGEHFVFKGRIEYPSLKIGVRKSFCYESGLIWDTENALVTPIRSTLKWSLA